MATKQHPPRNFPWLPSATSLGRVPWSCRGSPLPTAPSVSQLGYMFLGLGVLSTYGAAYHVFTHAFFKAALFLTCGTIMHGFAGQGVAPSVLRAQRRAANAAAAATKTTTAPARAPIRQFQRSQVITNTTSVLSAPATRRPRPAPQDPPV